MQQIHIRRPRARREHPWDEVLPPDPWDPDVVLAKALARAGDRAGRTTARQSRSRQVDYQVRGPHPWRRTYAI